MLSFLLGLPIDYNKKMVFFIIYHILSPVLTRPVCSRWLDIASLVLFCMFITLDLKCYYDQILDIHFFTFSHTIGESKTSCQISIYYEQQNSCFFNLSFREFTAAINFPCSKSGLRIGENDVIFSKIPHRLKL